METTDKFSGLKTYLLAQWVLVLLLCLKINNTPDMSFEGGIIASLVFATISVFLFVLYFTPTIVAVNNDSPQTQAVMVLNLFLGWTLVGWVMALVWAVSKPQVQIQYTQSSEVNIHQQNLTIIKELTVLDELKSKGSLSEDEYLTLKARLINPKP